MSSFKTGTSLTKVVEHIKNEFRGWVEKVNCINETNRAIMVSELYESEDFKLKHARLLEWVEANPNVTVALNGIAGWSERGNLLQFLAKMEANVKLPKLDLKEPRTDAVVAFVNFSQCETREDAIVAIMNKYYFYYPGFVRSFKASL
jgi:hypothetical protein